MMKFICPDSLNGVCTETRCGKCLVNPREDGVDDNLQPTYTASCTFDGTLQYFHGLKPSTDEGQPSGTTITNNAETRTITPAKRRAGVSATIGRAAHPAINVIPGMEVELTLKDGSREPYKFKGEKQWDIFNRFLKSLSAGQDHSPGHFPVDLDCNDVNRCKGEFRTLVATYIERQPVVIPAPGKRNEKKARLMVELLDYPIIQDCKRSVTATAAPKKRRKKA